ncbi:hypothetical protein BDA99DRAFT_543035 [Phascolomyces articulosus]|uniref:Uncharacterized protein n=1 Tax=Phascolomyces articulosus TaxID=60185 RepID=A0AAD5P9X8_9FUNG|nr:hypothetical protein BDA99DRAFT_543035 [Phascolomyces articulosus]
MDNDFIEVDIEYRAWFFIAKRFLSTKIRASSAFSEVDLADEGETGTEELYKSGLKTPKMLKVIFVSLTNRFPHSIHGSKTASFILSALFPPTPNSHHTSASSSSSSTDNEHTVLSLSNQRIIITVTISSLTSTFVHR